MTPCFAFRWLANLRVLEIDQIKSVPYASVSHPFIERLIGTIRREYLDRMFFWNAGDLTRKLGEFRDYYNADRVHRALRRRHSGATCRCTLPCSCCT
jgi:putative transposase